MQKINDLPVQPHITEGLCLGLQLLIYSELNVCGHSPKNVDIEILIPEGMD